MINIKEWFSNLITPEKKKYALWQELMSVFYEFYNKEVNPNIERIKNRRSLFTMNDEDLDIKMTELGRFFVIRSDSKTGRPMALAQRMDEIHFKGTERPIEATFWRELNKLPAVWEALYAPTNIEKYPYGTVFLQKQALESAKQIYGDFFLTSRGSISVSLNALRGGAYGNDFDEALKRLIEDVDLIIKPLIPLHIVFDGFRFVIEYTFIEEPTNLILMKTESKVRDYFKFIEDETLIKKANISSSIKHLAIYHQYRDLVETDVLVNNVCVNGWAVGLRAPTAILPESKVLDGRLYVVDDEVFIKNDGFNSCVVHLTYGEIHRYVFPSTATEIKLPISIERYQEIKKIIYSNYQARKIVINHGFVESESYLKAFKVRADISNSVFLLKDVKDTIDKVSISGSLMANLTGKSLPITKPFTVNDFPVNSWGVGMDVYNLTGDNDVSDS